jgi:putative transposase
MSAVRANMKMLMEASLDMDRTAQLGRPRHVRVNGFGQYRNGYYKRDLETGFGLIRQLRVPRVRGETLCQSLFARYRRRRQDVEHIVRTLFFAGVSTRGVGEVLEILLGFAPSASAVSVMVAAIDKEVKAYHGRLLGDLYAYLFLDALTVTLKEAPGARKRLVMVAYAISLEGRRVLLDYRIAQSESQAEWDRFLLSLVERGLQGTNLRLITTDGGQGLRAAVRDVYPEAPNQLCWAHKLRNVAAHLHKANEAACMDEARRIYQAQSRRDAIVAWRRWRDRWLHVEPDAVRCLERDIEALLPCFQCPEEHRKVVRTTNYIERLIRELRRRTRLMGAFADRPSCDRLFYGVVRRLDQRWSQRHVLPEFTHKP